MSVLEHYRQNFNSVYKKRIFFADIFRAHNLNLGLSAALFHRSKNVVESVPNIMLRVSCRVNSKTFSFSFLVVRMRRIKSLCVAKNAQVVNSMKMIRMAMSYKNRINFVNFIFQRLNSKFRPDIHKNIYRTFKKRAAS